MFLVASNAERAAANRYFAAQFALSRDLPVACFSLLPNAAQAAGCDPIIQALKKGTDLISPVKPNTIASSIAIGNPADGYYVLQAVRESGGWGESVTDEEILDAIKLLARTEGIFTEPAGGTEVAVAKKLIQQGRIPRDESIVISITGNGYKTLEVVAHSVEKPFRIHAHLKDFDELYLQITQPSSGKALAGEG